MCESGEIFINYTYSSVIGILSFLSISKSFLFICWQEIQEEMNSGSEKEDKDEAHQGKIIIKNAIYKNLMFNKTPQDLQKIIEDLPEGLYMHLFLLL